MLSFPSAARREQSSGEAVSPSAMDEALKQPLLFCPVLFSALLEFCLGYEPVKKAEIGAWSGREPWLVYLAPISRNTQFRVQFPLECARASEAFNGEWPGAQRGEISAGEP